MRQHQLARDVADGVDAVDVRLHAVVDLDEAALHRHADRLQTQAVAVAAEADGDERLVGGQLLVAAVAADGKLRLAVDDAQLLARPCAS